MPTYKCEACGRIYPSPNAVVAVYCNALTSCKGKLMTEVDEEGAAVKQVQVRKPRRPRSR